MNTVNVSKNKPDIEECKQSYLIQLFIVTFSTTMTAATFWPLAFDLIDYVSGMLGYPAEYASFNAIKPLYYFTALIVGIAIAYVTRAFFFTLILELANKAASNTQQISMKYLDPSSLQKGIQYTIAFLVVFLVAYYSLHGRLEAMKLKHSNYNLELRVATMSDAMACLRSVHNEDAVESIRQCFPKD
ncbi:MAG: hypothetical protein K2W88_09920 [Pararheinheimera sp.]|jgi:hypothetical protein|nr:hypothetical protein [Rheinheimera sp.]